MATVRGANQVSIEEAVKLGAVDGGFFGRFFFPRAFKQDPPEFHTELDLILDSPDFRNVSAMLFRGAAKTTKLRVYLARRIAYGISRTVMIVGKSQEAAMKTIEWLKRSIENNQKYANSFGLSPGSRWTGADVEIIHHHFQDENGGPLRIRVIAYGMTGSVRGVNIDDCRPDLIVVDDPCDEENTATPEARKKIADLFFGAIQKSLAPRSEAPHAKMVLLQTVLNSADLVSMCDKDPSWKSLRIGCFDENGKSRWEERLPTHELLADKQSHIARNQLSLWMREMECKVISEELAAFTDAQLRYWDNVENGIGGTVPSGGLTWLAIDPTPPPKDASKIKITARHDTFVVAVMRMVQGKIYILDFYGAKSPDPGEAINQIFTMCNTWHIRTIVVETILFQRMLKWALEREMQIRRQYFTIHPIEDKRAKETRIRQEISAYASQGALLCSQHHVEYAEQFSQYPAVTHDDYLDAVAIGLMYINTYMLEASYIDGEFEEVNEELDAIDWRADV